MSASACVDAFLNDLFFLCCRCWSVRRMSCICFRWGLSQGCFLANSTNSKCVQSTTQVLVRGPTLRSQCCPRPRCPTPPSPPLFRKPTSPRCCSDGMLLKNKGGRQSRASDLTCSTQGKWWTCRDPAPLSWWSSCIQVRATEPE